MHGRKVNWKWNIFDLQRATSFSFLTRGFEDSSQLPMGWKVLTLAETGLNNQYTI